MSPRLASAITGIWAVTARAASRSVCMPPTPSDRRACEEGGVRIEADTEEALVAPARLYELVAKRPTRSRSGPPPSPAHNIGVRVQGQGKPNYGSGPVG